MRLSKSFRVIDSGIITAIVDENTATKIRNREPFDYNLLNGVSILEITSNPYADPDAVLLTDESFVSGSLQRQSYAR